MSSGGTSRRRALKASEHRHCHHARAILCRHGESAFEEYVENEIRQSGGGDGDLGLLNQCRRLFLLVKVLDIYAPDEK